MTLKERLTEDMKSAMRGADKERLSTIRMAQAAIKQREVDERIALDDAQVLAVLEKMIKQRKESIVQFEQGGRADLAAKERAEIELLQTYMPAQLSPRRARHADPRGDRREAALRPSRTWARSWASSRARLPVRADMGAVSARIKAALSG